MKDVRWDGDSILLTIFALGAMILIGFGISVFSQESRYKVCMEVTKSIEKCAEVGE